MKMFFFFCVAVAGFLCGSLHYDNEANAAADEDHFRQRVLQLQSLKCRYDSSRQNRDAIRSEALRVSHDVRWDDLPDELRRWMAKIAWSNKAGY